MKEELISFETAKLAREKGFDVHCDWRYDEQTVKKEVINWKDYRVKECIQEDGAYAYKAVKYLAENYYDVFANNDDGFYLAAPTQNLLQKWLREKFFILIEVHHHTAFGAYSFRVKNVHSDKISTHKYDTYEKALEKGLFEALKLIK